MRIIAGKFKGRKIYNPQDNITRPLKDRVRESIFNIIKHSKEISFELINSNVLDLYSGVGSFGIESLSRNAKRVTFIEKDINASNILKENLKKLSIFQKTKILFLVPANPYVLELFLKVHQPLISQIHIRAQYHIHYFEQPSYQIQLK